MPINLSNEQIKLLKNIRDNPNDFIGCLDSHKERFLFQELITRGLIAYTVDETTADDFGASPRNGVEITQEGKGELDTFRRDALRWRLPFIATAVFSATAAIFSILNFIS